MKTLLTLFVLFFSSLVSAVEYPYEGDKPILPNLSADAGADYEYMRLCGGDLYKSAENTRKRVKELSTPDYKLFQKYRMLEFSKNYSHSINCEDNKWLIEANERYLNNLKRSIDDKSDPQNSTKNKILTDLSKHLQEIIYVCVDTNGKHSLRNNSNSSDTSCTSYTNKDTAQKIVESANSKLGKNKYKDFDLVQTLKNNILIIYSNTGKYEEWVLDLRDINISKILNLGEDNYYGDVNWKVINNCIVFDNNEQTVWYEKENKNGSETVYRKKNIYLDKFKRFRLKEMCLSKNNTSLNLVSKSYDAENDFGASDWADAVITLHPIKLGNFDYKDKDSLEQITEAKHVAENITEAKHVAANNNLNLYKIYQKKDFKKAQSALKKLGFYNGAIDGIFGSASIKALNAWQEQASLTLTTTISAALLKMLEQEAETIVFENQSEAIVFENQAETNKELEDAQNYINDLLAYIETYPSTFDILEITNFMIVNKNILKGSWGNLEKDGFKFFKNYTESSKDFLTFHANQNAIRDKDTLNKITTAENNVKKLINYFTSYLQQNVTSALAPDILDNIKLARDTLGSKDIGKLNNVITKLNTYIADKNLTSDYTKFAATQKDAVDNKTEMKNEEKKINTTQISSKEDFKKAQSALKKLGFYDGVVDGLFGSASIKALNAWQEQASLTLTTTISVDLLAKLEKASNASTNEVVKQEIIVDTKITEKTMYDAEQQTAQNYILDLFNFISANPDTFDIIQITELITVNKPILNNKWNKVQQKDFALLKDYTATSEEFVKFHAIQNDQRQKEILNEIALQNSKLKNIIGYFRYYLKNNLASDISLSIIKNIKFAETYLEDQNLGALNNANAELETFIANNNLTMDYKTYVSSLSISDLKKSTITASNIDAIDLVNFDFIKEADDSDFIVLVNLSGQAPNALLNLEGKVVFEKDIAYSCFYQSKEIKNDLKYYLYDKVANQKFLAFDQGFECNQNSLLNYDLIFFEKDALLREEKSYVSTLAAAIGSDQLQLFTSVTKKEYEKDFFQREMFAVQIKDDVLNEARLGFGALIIANDNTTLCTDVDSSLGQLSIMNLLDNEFIRMGYGKSVNDIVFNTTEDTFTNVQRGNCGFIYAGETSLNNLMTAFENSNTSYDVLPRWLSKKQVANEQLRQESKEKSLLIDLQKKKEQIEKEKKLEQERLKADGILKAQEQQVLRDRNRVVVEGHIELMEDEIKHLFNKDSFKDTWLYESYPDLGKLMEKKFKEKWELDQSNVTINDYGLSDYKGRKIATFITDINFRLMNRDLGEYEIMCFRLAIISDREFSRWREPEAAVCKTDDDNDLGPDDLYEKYKHALDTYKKRLNFQSAWIVE